MRSSFSPKKRREELSFVYASPTHEFFPIPLDFPCLLLLKREELFLRYSYLGYI
jgi:hypothetical protein